MKINKVILLFLILTSTFWFCESIKIETKQKMSYKKSMIVNQTILNYGATVYPSKEAALQSKKSSHLAIQKMLDSVHVAILPSYGWFYLDETTILWGNKYSIKSLGQGNKGVNLVTDKSISMFLPVANDHSIKGFTAWYENVEGECAVVRYGGDKRNIGALYETPDKSIIHFRPRRTNSVANDLDFDLVGNAHGVWVNYDDESENKHSHCHFLKVRGLYRNCNTPIKVNRFFDSQSINTFDIKLKVWGAKQFAQMNNINHSEIQILGQETKYHKMPLWEIKGINIIADIFVYDVGGKRKGDYHVNGLSFIGISKLKYSERNDIKIMPNTKFNKSILK